MGDKAGSSGVVSMRPRMKGRQKREISAPAGYFGFLEYCLSGGCGCGGGGDDTGKRGAGKWAQAAGFHPSSIG